jgi:hypothetical protein
MQSIIIEIKSTEYLVYFLYSEAEKFANYPDPDQIQDVFKLASQEKDGEIVKVATAMTEKEKKDFYREYNCWAFKQIKEERAEYAVLDAEDNEETNNR